ncbi:MAG: nucleotide exchange factor GrpE [Candidatus Bathyarchaeota archaeon]|nr:nucleotide exchange factor GrpE [Candidatus Bathyarchaeota archaeon]
MIENKPLNKQSNGNPIEKQTIENQDFCEIKAAMFSMLEQKENEKQQLNFLLHEIDTWAVKQWQRENQLSDDYDRVIKSLLLVIDHFGTAKEGNRDIAEWILGKIKRIIEDEGFEEIKVAQGDSFDGIYHQCVGQRSDVISDGDGEVVEIVRPGYLRKNSSNKGQTVFRPVEVIVSQKTNGS